MRATFGPRRDDARFGSHPEVRHIGPSGSSCRSRRRLEISRTHVMFHVKPLVRRLAAIRLSPNDSMGYSAADCPTSR